MTRYALALVVILGWAAAGPHSAHAHAFDPPIVELRELDGGAARVRVLLSPTSPADEMPQVSLPAHCTRVGEVTRRLTPERRIHSWRADCGHQGLFGHSITVSGPHGSAVDSIVHAQGGEREPFTAVLSSSQPSLQLPGEADPGGRFFETVIAYLELGVEHILLGVDHLLFVLGLLLMVRGRGALLATITAFTLGHSVTLGLAVLGIVELRPAPVEAVIALSIVFLAREVARGRGSSSLASTRPWLIAAGFGLLHGFGFAGALSELGVPEGAIPLSLAAFNVGVELGQLLFVAVILLALDLLRRLGLANSRGWRMAPAYAMGIVGGLWVLERVATVMGIAAFA